MTTLSDLNLSQDFFGEDMKSNLPRRSLIPRTTDDLLKWFHTEKGRPSEKRCLDYLHRIARQACGDNCPVCGYALPAPTRQRRLRQCARPDCDGVEEKVPTTSLLGRRRKPVYYHWVMAAWTFSQEKQPMSPHVLRAYGTSNKTARRMILIFQEAMAIEYPPGPIDQQAVITVELEGGRKVLVDLLELMKGKTSYAGARLSKASGKSEEEDLKGFRPSKEWSAFSGGWSGRPKDSEDLRLRLAEFTFNQRWKRQGRRPETTMVRLLELLLTPAPGPKV